MKKIRSLINFWQIFGLSYQFRLLGPIKLSAVLQTNRQIFADFSHLLSQTSLKLPFPGPKSPVCPLVKAVKGLINQTKWPICQVWQSPVATANHSQEVSLWI